MFCWGLSIIIIKVALVGLQIDIHAVVVYLRFKLFGGNLNDDSVRSIGISQGSTWPLNVDADTPQSSFRALINSKIFFNPIFTISFGNLPTGFWGFGVLGFWV